MKDLYPSKGYLTELATAPDTPASGGLTVYPINGQLYAIDDDGVIRIVGGLNLGTVKDESNLLTYTDIRSLESSDWISDSVNDAEGIVKATPHPLYRMSGCGYADPNGFLGVISSGFGDQCALIRNSGVSLSTSRDADGSWMHVYSGGGGSSPYSVQFNTAYGNVQARWSPMVKVRIRTPPDISTANSTIWCNFGLAIGDLGISGQKESSYFASDSIALKFNSWESSKFRFWRIDTGSPGTLTAKDLAGSPTVQASTIYTLCMWISGNTAYASVDGGTPDTFDISALNLTRNIYPQFCTGFDADRSMDISYLYAEWD